MTTNRKQTYIFFWPRYMQGSVLHPFRSFASRDGLGRGLLYSFYPKNSLILPCLPCLLTDTKKTILDLIVRGQDMTVQTNVLRICMGSSQPLGLQCRLFVCVRRLLSEKKRCRNASYML